MQYTSRVDDWDPYTRPRLAPNRPPPRLYPSSAPTLVPATNTPAPPAPIPPAPTPLSPTTATLPIFPNWTSRLWERTDLIIMGVAFVFFILLVWLFVQNRDLQRLQNSVVQLNQNLQFQVQMLQHMYNTRPY